MSAENIIERLRLSVLNYNADKTVSAVKELKSDVVGLSALLTTTLPGQRTVIEALKRGDLRDKVKVIIGELQPAEMD